MQDAEPAQESTGARKGHDSMAKARAGFTPETIARRGRSKVANGSAFLVGVPGTSMWARRLKEILVAAIADMGGSSNVSEAERHILRRACVLAVEAERLESEFAVGKPDIAALDVYARIASSMRRLFESVGLQRRAKTVGPSLSDLMVDDLRQTREREDAKQVDAVAELVEPDAKPE